MPAEYHDALWPPLPPNPPPALLATAQHKTGSKKKQASATLSGMVNLYEDFLYFFFHSASVTLNVTSTLSGEWFLMLATSKKLGRFAKIIFIILRLLQFIGQTNNCWYCVYIVIILKTGEKLFDQKVS